MSRNWIRATLRLCVGIVALGWASLAAAAKPQSTAHPCEVTVADRVGDSILSDGGGKYTEGIDAAAMEFLGQ